jgi:heme-degrading monooxygenase HmoA
MPVGMTVEIPGMTAAIYQQVMTNLAWGPDNLPEGFIAHYACEKPDGLFVFDVWETADDWQRFAESRLGAAIGAATGGEGPRPEPRFFPLIREERR